MHLRVFMLLLIAGCRAHGAPSALSSGADTFEGNTVRAYAASPGDGSRWSIVDGHLVGTGPALQSVLLRRGVAFADGWVEATSAHADDAGLVLRYRGPADYYLLAFRDDDAPAPRGNRNLALYHRTGGAFREIWTRDISWPRGVSRTVRLEADHTHFRIYVDGDLRGTVRPSPSSNDPAPYFGAGGVGVRNYGADRKWRSHFADFRWQSADARR